MIAGKSIFITGGAGFIASALLKHLLADNQVTIFDNFVRNTLKFSDLQQHPNLHVIQGDVLDFDTLSMALQTADPHFIIHAAAIAGIESTVKNPVTTMRVNMLGTANVLEAAKSLTHLERLVDFSTSEVFGSFAYKVDETHQTMTGAVGEARWTYAVSKLAGEHIAHAYFKQYEMPVVTVRPFNVYGPGQIGEGALSIFIRKALRNEDIVIFGDGSQIRAWCYVDDMIEGILCCLTNPGAVGQSFNIGNARAVATVYGLAQTVCRALGSHSRIVFKEALSADIELRIPKTQKAKELLGFEAQVELDEGIKRTADWIANNQEMLPEMSAYFKV